MATEDFKRKLAAILSADVAGYSRLMAEDESATVKTLETYREVMFTLIKQHRGRVIDSPGDNLLSEFTSVVDAVQCAVAMQKEFQARNAELPENRRMEFRIGVNLGDVIEEGDRIYGDGVNIASRLEGLADPGGICVSKTAFDQIETKLPLGYEYLGEQPVKNMPKPVGAYRVLMDPRVTVAGKIEKEKDLPVWRRKAFVSAGVVLVFVIIAALVWNFYFLRPPIETASVDRMAFSLPDKPSIAVLPFVNMSGDPKQEFFSDGMTEEIITALSKTPRLFVVARDSTFTYKGKPVKIQKVAEDLGVRYVLKGSVRRSGNNVRVTAQLIDALKGFHLWAEKYDRDLEDIFAIQDDITREIIVALKVKLTEGEQARIWSRGTKNVKALDKAFESLEYFRRFGRDDFILCRKKADEALALDPNYPFGVMMLAWSHLIEVWLGYSKSPGESMKKAVELAKKTLALDENYADAYALLGSIYVIQKQWDKAIEVGKRSVELSPSGADVNALLGLTLDNSGMHKEAILLLKKAIRLNPIAPNWYYHNLAAAQIFTGNYQEAVPYLKKILVKNPNYAQARLYLIVAYSLLNQDEEAKIQVEEYLKLRPNQTIEGMLKRSNLRQESDRDLIYGALRKAGLPETPPLPLPDKPAIAVLPFVNMSDDPEQEYFADGMTDDLITDLSKLSGILVIARNSTFTYKGKQVKVQKVSQDLGARYVVEGTVRKAGNDIRINAQLIDATTGHHLWAERYDGKLQNIFSFQDKITRKIVSSLAVKLGAREQKDVERPETESIEAYDALLKGYEYYFRGTVNYAVMAISYFEKAIELDQNYGRAYAALAKTYFLGPKIRREWYAKKGLNYQTSMVRARHYLQMANKRPTSTSHQIASLMALHRRKYKKAMAEAELALSLEPNGVESNFNMGYVLVFLGRAKEGIDYLKRSIELDPLHPGWALFYMGLARFSTGQFDEAVELIKRALTYNPKTHKMLGILAAAYAHLGRAEEARDTLQNYLRGFQARPDLNGIMSDWPLKDPKDADRLAEGLIKAGLPGQASDYLKVLKENKLTGEEIRKLLFGRTRTGHIYGRERPAWTINSTKDGKVEYMDPSRYDTGKNWIEGDSSFIQFDSLYEGRKYSCEVYRNPHGTPKKMDEYFIIVDWGIYPFSVVD